MSRIADAATEWAPTPRVAIIVPVYNEEAVIQAGGAKVCSRSNTPRSMYWSSTTVPPIDTLERASAP